MAEQTWIVAEVERRLSVVEELDALVTYLLCLKIADKQAKPPFNKPSAVPKRHDWPNPRQFSLQKVLSGGLCEPHHHCQE